jgi:hypothetical protein
MCSPTPDGNEKTVTVEHVAGIAVRNPQMVAFARHYAVTVHTCEPADPASKGGSESTVKLAKADLVPKDTNLLAAYGSFAELEAACAAFCQLVNTRVHRVTRRTPTEMLAEEQARLHPVPAHPHTVAFGLTRTVPPTMPMVAFESGQYSVPHTLCGKRCGFGSTVGAQTSRSSSSTSPPPVRCWDRSRSPGTGAPTQAAHNWSMSTSRQPQQGHWTAGHGRRTLRMRSSSPG